MFMAHPRYPKYGTTVFCWRSGRLGLQVILIMVIKIVVGALVGMSVSVAHAAADAVEGTSVTEVPRPGISLGLRYTTDVARNWVGGLERRGSWIGSLGLSADLYDLAALRGADVHFEAL